MARKTLSDRGVAALKPRAAVTLCRIPSCAGITSGFSRSGAKSFVTVARNPDGKQIWTTIGSADVVSIDEARAKAREVIGRVRAGLPPVEAKADTFEDVAELWRKRHVEANQLRSAKEITRLLRVHVYPRMDRPAVSQHPPQ